MNPSGVQVVGAFVLYLFMQWLLLPSLAVLAILAFPVVDTDQVQTWTGVVGMFLVTGMLALYTYGLPGVTIWEKQALSWRQRYRQVLLGMLSWFAAFPIVNVIVQAVESVMNRFVDSPPIEQTAVRQLKAVAGEPTLFLFLCLAIVTVVPIAEELLFRGFLQGWLKSRFGRRKALWGAAAVFALVHFSLSQGYANAPLILALLSLALILGLLYEYSGALWAPIALHSVFNSVSVAVIISGEKIL